MFIKNVIQFKHKEKTWLVKVNFLIVILLHLQYTERKFFGSLQAWTK
jgi:hypothetical protein